MFIFHTPLPAKFYYLGLLVLSMGFAIGPVQGQQSSAATDLYRNVLNQYCVSCHNEALKTANVLLDQANVNDIRQDPQLWEKVIVKLNI